MINETALTVSNEVRISKVELKKLNSKASLIEKVLEIQSLLVQLESDIQSNRKPFTTQLVFPFKAEPSTSLISLSPSQGDVGDAGEELSQTIIENPPEVITVVAPTEPSKPPVDYKWKICWNTAMRQVLFSLEQKCLDWHKLDENFRQLLSLKDKKMLKKSVQDGDKLRDFQGKEVRFQ